ncbi:MAG TPA: NAD(P)/FAD-dependent oxidoreductase [Planctomycetota bacterium]|jgi:flavin-dependent dehydrogenase|nr:NAD(P)/FAD-dependent oxidoreductase [Planctomycetota bacterium]
MNDFEVIIVGAGPAGSALAAFLGAGGKRTLLVDKARFPRDKVCGEYMSPEALGTLDRLGVLGQVEASAHRKLYGILIHAYDGIASRGTYRPVGPYAPYRPYGLAIRREVFDAVLFRHAISYPSVTAMEGFRVEDLLLQDGRVSGIRGSAGEFRSGLVVGADGARSVVGRALGLSDLDSSLQKFALAGYWKDMEHEDYGELHMGFPGYFALAPVDQNLVNINFVLDKSAMGGARGDMEGFYRHCLERNPRLRKRLRNARLQGPVRATGPMARRCRGTAAPGALLIGDAAEFVDPFTGEGLFVALRSAELAARFILEGEAASLERFARARKAEFGEKLRMCWQLQKFLYKPALANYVVHRLAARPILADRLTAVTGDYVPPGAVMTFSFFLELFNPFLGSSAHVAG